MQQAMDFCHGRLALAACQGVLGAQVATLALDPAWQEVDLSRLLFVDTETTGLAGGAGTLPFVVGLGYFTAHGWCTEQLILPQPGDEAPLLRHLADRLAACSGMVTYNGKSFDWPLLRMRFILNRVALPPLQHHLDLLHCVRRVYKRRPGPLRLVHMEQHLLDFWRQGDIDGAAIPELYFAFLRGAPAATLGPVITHNRHDLAAMAAILAALAPTLASPHSSHTAAECLSIAELHLRAGKLPQARQLAQRSSLGAANDVDAHLLLAQLCRRQKDHAACLSALQAALHSAADKSAAVQATIHLMLAKLHEHRLGNLEAARTHAQQTLASEGSLAQHKRLGRLERKLSRGRIVA